MTTIKTIAALAAILALAACGWRGQKKAGGETANETAESTVNAGITETRAESAQGGEDASSFFITAYTPFDQKIVDDSYLPHGGSDEGEWTEITPDSRIATGWAEGTDDGGLLVGLSERLELGKEWLCVELPRYSPTTSRLNLQTGKTVAYAEDWLEDSLTVLEGVNGDFDMGFRDLRAEDFRCLEQEAVEDREERRRINDLIGTAIHEGKIMSYRNPQDTMRLRSLNRFAFGQRQLLVANYTTVEGQYDFVYIVENTDITSFNLLNSHYSEIHFFTLADDTVYQVHLEGRYGIEITTMRALDPETASRDRTVFKFSKYTD